ncbi:sulfurtransferase TusA family protein [Microaerobacter geothermalis]|uniref:sulfurtransferase TusA family protein n=1 Tax=Microaerobacter geothermalis TaxID=674972 RepID=UPI001F2E41D1|nr:sulfurtransferase TusA family protein [Microaerobacter geothermalis]MCF6093585.1 sulfurtransferase TusA family protein [Microaerobacter geothermalis]
MEITVDKVLDARGLSCPMPIVKTKKAMDDMAPGQVIEVQATDKGSVADMQGWAKSTGHQFLGTIEEDGVFKHYLRKASPEEIKEEMKYPHTITNEELQKKLEQNHKISILDVREPAEYAFGHIPGAKCIPLGELEDRINELNQNDEIYVVCRTANRSDIAAKILAEKGYKHVKNVVPGMSEWTGPTEKYEQKIKEGI